MTNTIAYIGIGSNLDHPRAQVVSAVRALGEIPGVRVSGRSSLYLCKPWGRADQPDFVNAAVRL
ncbi:MAG TPA: 2-amino-4-hydroxy-6-hydroxymethyldihydropteridine diphosphokinase, partial [Dokdonella sp.]|nr:2-amino-4-hydroxy-6-hydroxymethyldihydropteridine diphosphokinase [Dokdonella sp.]